jgi:ketosteroid isomerase-like protein
MGLQRATPLAALDVYKTAWEQQDAARTLTTFTPDAVYHERVLEEPIRGHAGIAAYWQEKGLCRNFYAMPETSCQVWRLWS